MPPPMSVTLVIPAQNAQRFFGNQRLAAQDAVLIGEREADRIQPLLFHDTP